MSNWTLFSNHGHVLVCLARDPQARLRDVAADVGITERAVQKIVRDLQDGGMISVTKSGRRNCYRIHGKQALRHNLEAGCKVRDLIKVVNRTAGQESSPANRRDAPGRGAKRKSGPPVSPGDTKLASETKSQKVKPEPDIPTPKKNGPEDSGPPDGTERQQGTLF